MGNAASESVMNENLMLIYHRLFGNRFKYGWRQEFVSQTISSASLQISVMTLTGNSRKKHKSLTLSYHTCDSCI